MKWIFAIDQKLKAAIALLTVLLLVLATNLINQKHFSDLHDSYTSVYEDRLVAETYLFDLSNKLQLKKQLLQNEDLNLDEISVLNHQVSEIIEKYEATKLTAEEAGYFESLKIRLSELLQLEEQYYLDQISGDIMDKQFELLTANLNSLSEIQIIEGQRLIANSDQIISINSLTSRLEIAILIIVGLIIQSIIFASKSATPTFTQNSRLN